MEELGRLKKKFVNPDYTLETSEYDFTLDSLEEENIKAQINKILENYKVL